MLRRSPDPTMSHSKPFLLYLGNFVTHPQINPTFSFVLAQALREWVPVQTVGTSQIATPKTLADAWYSTLGDASATSVNRRIRIESFLVPSDPGESLQLAKYSLRFPSAFRRLAHSDGPRTHECLVRHFPARRRCCVLASFCTTACRLHAIKLRWCTTSCIWTNMNSSYARDSMAAFSGSESFTRATGMIWPWRLGNNSPNKKLKSPWWGQEWTPFGLDGHSDPRTCIWSPSWHPRNGINLPETLTSS